METAMHSVTKQITDALMNDPRTKGCIIDVGYNQGVVILTGTVKSASMSQAAEEIARSTPGVLSVTNELKVG